MLHSILSKLPKPLNLDSLITHAANLHKKHPPARLSGWTWFHISSNSVLKTTRELEPLARQTLQDGEAYFERQAAETRAHDARQKTLARARVLGGRYKRPALITSTTILTALVAIYLRRNGASTEWLVPLLQPILALRTNVAGLIRCLHS
jgi:hypothetical protein